MLLLFCIMSETDSDWGTSVVTGKDDNVSGLSECEIRDVGEPARLRVYRLANTHSLHSVSGLIDTVLVR